MRSSLSAKRRCFAFILGGLLISGSRMEAQSNAPAAVSTVPPIHVDLETSRVYIKVGKTGFGHEHGVVGRLRSGFLRLGAASEAGVLDFDMTSFVADTKVARQYVGLEGETDADTARQVTDNMLGSHVLDAQHHPLARYAIKSALPVQSQAPGRPMQFQLIGDFTLHGVTRPLQLTAEARADERGWRLLTRFAILQSNFGITPYSKAFGAVGVADQLGIWGDLHLVTTPAQAQTPANQPRR